MAQAKTLTPEEIERLLTHINTRKYAARNRSMMLLTHWAGLRIGEVAGLRWSDVTTTDGLVKATAQTKSFLAMLAPGATSYQVNLGGMEE